MHTESSFRIALNWSYIGKMTMTSKFADMKSSSNCFDFVLFFLLSLVTGPSFMSISSLVLELWQFIIIRDWPEIRKWEIPKSELCPISGHWSDTKFGTSKITIFYCPSDVLCSSDESVQIRHWYVTLICVPFSLGSICKYWILLMKTNRGYVRYRKHQVFL